MTVIDIFNFSGLLLTILGSLILSFSLGKYLTSMHGALAILDLQVKGIVKREEKNTDADIGRLLKIGINDSRKKMKVGLIIVVGEFIVQLVPYILLMMKVKF
jgi:hypothetical protein